MSDRIRKSRHFMIRQIPPFWYSIRRVGLKSEQRCRGRRKRSRMRLDAGCAWAGNAIFKASSQRNVVNVVNARASLALDFSMLKAERAPLPPHNMVQRFLSFRERYFRSLSRIIIPSPDPILCPLPFPDGALMLFCMRCRRNCRTTS